MKVVNFLQFIKFNEAKFKSCSLLLINNILLRKFKIAQFFVIFKI